MKTGIFMMIVISAIISFSSCNKEASIIDETGVNIADDDAVIEAVFEDVFSTVDNATIILDNMTKGEDAFSAYAEADTCPLITVTNPSGGFWPRIVTVDYGAGCEGFNGNVRSGKIIIEGTAPRIEAGSKRTVTFVDYFFNDIKVEGVKVLENTGFNADHNLVMSIMLTGGKLTLPDGSIIERSSEHQREWIAGLLTRNIWDDECLVTGTATGVDINGVIYNNRIMTALHWTRACRFIIAGVVEIERGESLPVEIDYGAGECDAKAVVTVGEESREILLKNRHRSMWNN